MEKNIAIELNKELCEKLYIAPWARKPEEAINKIAERYLYLISDEKKKILRIFSDDEIFFMCCIACEEKDWSPAEKLHNGVLRVADSFEDDFYELSSLSKTQLEDKLRSLTVLQQFALVDYIEEYWYQHDDIRNIEKICKSEAPAEEAINEGDTRTPEQIIADICAQLKNKA